MLVVCLSLIYVTVLRIVVLLIQVPYHPLLGSMYILHGFQYVKAHPPCNVDTKTTSSLSWSTYAPSPSSSQSESLISTNIPGRLHKISFLVFSINTRGGRDKIKKGMRGILHRAVEYEEILPFWLDIFARQQGYQIRYGGRGREGEGQGFAVGEEGFQPPAAIC